MDSKSDIVDASTTLTGTTTLPPVHEAFGFSEQDSQSNDAEVSDAYERTKSDKIREQVEYYFSDANLAKDNYLVGKMHGHRNAPVSLRAIHSFRKMEGFQPFSAVVEAVKESKVLDVVYVDGRESVVRKVPYYRPNPGIGKKRRPTGFEYSWTDGPITPDEHAEERSLYNPEERSFADRMELALHRYRAKRKFTPRIAQVYTKFLKFGGVDSGQKQFAGGLSRDEIDNCTADEIADMKAVDFLGADKLVTGPDQEWNVDFEGVAKGFLSTQIPNFFSPQTDEQVKFMVNVLRNFYNYILQHEVCPEYTFSILAARQVCHMAEIELPRTRQALKLFPGCFNIACSTLFGGHFNGMYAGDQEWCKGFPDAQPEIGMSDERAIQVFSAAMKFMCSKESRTVPETKGELQQEIIQTENRVGLEVSNVISPSLEAQTYYENHAHGIKPIGKLECRPYKLPGLVGEDDEADDSGHNCRPASYVFLVEEDLLNCCFPGMKMDAVIHTLSNGFKFLDNVLGVYCSFYTALENEKLKKPKPTFPEGAD